jgi:hypothetical protein
MKIVEQYLRAVGYSLPMKKREDVTRELHSLMMEESIAWMYRKLLKNYPKTGTNVGVS